MARYFCSVAAADRQEPVGATASRVDRWLLVEAPGPWSPRSLPHPRGLSDEVLLEVQRRAGRAGARTVLVRRPGRGDPADALGSARRIFVADCRPGHERLLVRRVRDTALPELALPFDTEVNEPVAEGWRPLQRLLAVCTHGRHDPCCAVWGRPVAATLARAEPNDTWEVSHLGGDRFAANLLVLPHGHYLGRVPPTLATDVVAALARGARPPLYYRGRCCYPMAVQAAMGLAADRLGRTDLDALLPVTSRRQGERDWAVTLSERDESGSETGQRWQVVVRRDRGEPARLTCHAGHEEPTPDWRLVELTAIP